MIRQQSGTEEILSLTALLKKSPFGGFLQNVYICNWKISKHIIYIIMDTAALVIIACMSTIAGIAGIAVLIELYNSHKAERV